MLIINNIKAASVTVNSCSVTDPHTARSTVRYRERKNCFFSVKDTHDPFTDTFITRPNSRVLTYNLTSAIYPKQITVHMRRECVEQPWKETFMRLKICYFGTKPNENEKQVLSRNIRAQKRTQILTVLLQTAAILV